MVVMSVYCRPLSIWNSAPVSSIAPTSALAPSSACLDRSGGRMAPALATARPPAVRGAVPPFSRLSM
ncbi:hypothetical protein D3C72_2376660 [compost metagenome]